MRCCFVPHANSVQVADIKHVKLIGTGLAETCVHPPDIASIITREFLGFGSAATATQSTANSRTSTSVQNIHLLTVLATINADPDFTFDFEGLDGLQKFGLVKEKASTKLKQYVEQWISVEAVCVAAKGGRDDGRGELSPDVEDLLEQMVWAITLMYGVSGWRGAERGFVADFFTCVRSLFFRALCH